MRHEHEATDPSPPQDTDADADADADEESLVDEMRDSGVGVEDPHIVGDPTPGIVDEQVADEEPPRV